jgi:hypothetical protein
MKTEQNRKEKEKEHDWVKNKRKKEKKKRKEKTKRKKRKEKKKRKKRKENGYQALSTGRNRTMSGFFSQAAYIFCFSQSTMSRVSSRSNSSRR